MSTPPDAIRLSTGSGGLERPEVRDLLARAASDVRATQHA
jgi:hypothetical protein